MLLARYRRRWFVVLSALLLLAGSASWMCRVYLLHTLAEAWVISDPVTAADVVAVLGGGLQTRPFAAARYYHRGLVSKVLVASVQRSPSDGLDVSPSETSLNRAILLRLGVPETAIETFGQ